MLTNMAGRNAEGTCFWDKEATAATYSNSNQDLFRPNTSKIIELAQKLFPPKSDLRILDLASGTGNPAIVLAIAFPASTIHASGGLSAQSTLVRKRISGTSSLQPNTSSTCRCGASHVTEATGERKGTRSCKPDMSSSGRSGSVLR